MPSPAAGELGGAGVADDRPGEGAADTYLMRDEHAGQIDPARGPIRAHAPRTVLAPIGLTGEAATAETMYLSAYRCGASHGIFGTSLIHRAALREQNSSSGAAPGQLCQPPSPNISRRLARGDSARCPRQVL